MRQILLLRHAPELAQEIKEELGEDAYAEALTVVSSNESRLSHETLRTFLDALGRMRFSPVPSLPLELAVLELVRS